jgi:hypothetical protein
VGEQPEYFLPPDLCATNGEVGYLRLRWISKIEVPPIFTTELSLAKSPSPPFPTGPFPWAHFRHSYPAPFPMPSVTGLLGSSAACFGRAGTGFGSSGEGRLLQQLRNSLDVSLEAL